MLVDKLLVLAKTVETGCERVHVVFLQVPRNPQTLLLGQFLQVLLEERREPAYHQRELHGLA